MSLDPRNVTLQDYDGNVLAGFWQYGNISWNSFSTWLNPLIQTNHQWAIFDLDEDSPGRHGALAQRPLGPAIVPLGDYILLQQDGSPLQVALTKETARLRQPTHSNSPAQLDHYLNRARDRDGKCLITGLATRSRLNAAHIFPRTHVTEWLRKGYHNFVTDTAPALSVGGHSKIDSIQNVFMLRTDLRDAWANYEYGIDPDDNYRVTAFINGLSDVHGLELYLDHIVDPTVRPLDELFRDHFFQGVLKHIKGVGEPIWDYEDALGGAFDLSRQEVWGSEEGKKRLELELSDRLFEHKVAQDFGPVSPVRV